MAEKPAAKGAAPKAPAKKGLTYGRFKNYKKEGSSVKLQNVSCPKCGPGFLMANHKDRKTCGKCGYTEKK